MLDPANWSAWSLAESPLTDWRSIFQLGNLLAFAGIAVTVYYALRAERKASTALEAAVSARKALLLRFAAEEFTGIQGVLQSLRQEVRTGDIARAEEIAQSLSFALASAKTSWVEIREIEHEDIAQSLAWVGRVLVLLRNPPLEDNEKRRQVSEILDLVNQLIGQVCGRLRFPS